MATRKRGSNEFVGRIGDETHYIRKNKMVARIAKNAQCTKPKTAKQKNKQKDFGLISRLMSIMLRYINIGFHIEAKDTDGTAWNMANKVNKRDALQGEYPNQEIDFSKVKLSEGKIPMDKNPFEMTLTPRGVLVRWNPLIPLKGMNVHDRLMIVAYSPEKNSLQMDLDGPRRREGEYELILPPHRDKYMYHVYASFIAWNASAISDSIYLGSVDFLRVKQDPAPSA